MNGFWWKPKVRKTVQAMFFTACIFVLAAICYISVYMMLLIASPLG